MNFQFFYKNSNSCSIEHLGTVKNISGRHEKKIGQDYNMFNSISSTKDVKINIKK